MRVRVTEGGATQPPAAVDLASAGELAPRLAAPLVVRLRYGLVAGEAAVLLILRYGFDVPLRLGLLFLPIAAAAASNVWLSYTLRRTGSDARRYLGWIFCLDTLCLTALLALSGGPMNPFSLIYLVQITLSAVILRKIWTWTLGGLSMLCFALLFRFYEPLSIFEHHHHPQSFSLHLAGMWVAFAVAALLISFFIGRLSEVLRHREQEVLRLQSEIARNQRLASLVTLSAGAAHELNTPLGTVAIVAREIERYAETVAKDPALSEDAAVIRVQVERCREILRRMSARGAEPLGEAPAQGRVRDLIEMAARRFPPEQQAAIEIVCDETAEAQLPVEATVQAIEALVKNALDASAAGSPVQIEARADEGRLRLRIADRGEGMAPEVLSRIAEPFFTTKAPGRGMGLGVFLVRVFAERLGGALEYDSQPGAGTTATLELPASMEQISQHATA